MNVMNRPHNFGNGLNQIRQGRKYYYLYHEKTAEGRGIRVLRSISLDRAFESRDWDAFTSAEANALGGEYTPADE